MEDSGTTCSLSFCMQASELQIKYVILLTPMCVSDLNLPYDCSDIIWPMLNAYLRLLLCQCRLGDSDIVAAHD
jgi:hypothetical protein